MYNVSKLFDLNPQLGLLNDIYQDTSNVFRESSLSNYVQIAVAEVFSRVKDKSLFSLEIESRLTTEKLHNALSPDRYRYFHSLNLSDINHALDLSEDLGGVAHFLSDHVNSLDAVKIDCDRARLSAIRCANKPNVCHISEDLDKIKWPEGHYDLIVIAEFEALQISKNDHIDLLARLQASLTPSGVLVVNTRNRQRISKFFDPDHQDRSDLVPFYDLYNTDYDQEYERKELRDCLANANFSAIEFHATLSQDDRCQNLFSEDYLCSNLNAKNHFYRLGAIQNPLLSEFLLFSNTKNNHQRVFDQASRFVVFAGSSTKFTRRIYDNDFSYYAGNSRKAKWRTVTERNRAAAQVSKKSIYPELACEILDEGGSSPSVVQNLAPQPFYKGRLLIEDWIQAVLDNDPQTLRDLVTEYSAWLEKLTEQDNFTEIAYDLLPFNIVLNERGAARQYQMIDTEWQIDGNFDADFVIYRALFWFAYENRALLKKFAHKTNLSSIASFVVQYHPNVGQIHELARFTALEEHLQSQIANDFRAKAVEQALLQSFDGMPEVESSSPRCQVMWGNSAGQMDLESAVFKEWSADLHPQTLVIDLPPFDPDRTMLRIDPIASRGIFAINKIQLLGADKKLITNLESAEEIKQACEFNNAEATTEGFVALNDDPHVLLELSESSNLDSAQRLVLELNLLHDEHYEGALETLSSAVTNQNQALIRQQNSLNEYRSELEFTKLRLAEAIEHRTDLNSLYQDLDAKKLQELHQLKLRNINLEDQLHAQLGRNQEMESFLMMRPSTRIKRLATRILARVTGKKLAPEVTDDVPPESTDKEPGNDSAADSKQSSSSLTEEVQAEPIQAEPIQAEPFIDPNIFPDKNELLGQNIEDYQLWVSENDLSDAEIAGAKKEIEQFEHHPVFSILVPIYNTDPEYLIPMIRSVQAQIYPHWQLCLVDDASPKKYLKQILEYEASQDSRISIQLNDQNQGISLTTNDALALATGDYIGLLDHDDELSIDALYENAKAINEHPDLGLAYSDEDKMDMQGNRLEPFFKPDYSPDLLNTNNYVCHFTVIKKSIADEIGGFQEGLDGSQDHDIILRAIQKSQRVVHIPKILYHWRKIPGSTAVVYDSKSYAWEAGRKAIENCLKKTEDGVHVEFGTLKGSYRVFREIQGEPLVSIVIPFKDKPELLDMCLGSILARTSYPNFEIIGVSNSSEQPETFARMTHFSELDSRIRFIEKNIPFNFSALCNFGASQAKGEYLLLLNNDIEIQSPDWIERLLEHAQRDGIGAVGGKLLFPDGRIQHAGVVAGMVGAAGHPHKFFPDNHIGYHGRLHMVYNVSAVTGAMMMLSLDKFNDVGGLDETNLEVAYNDIDLCLKLIDKGYLNVFTPHCRAIHHESLSRGYEDTPEKLSRLKKEQSFFLNKWKSFLDKGDPFYNPNLSLKNERFSLRFKD